MHNEQNDPPKHKRQEDRRLHCLSKSSLHQMVLLHQNGKQKMSSQHRKIMKSRASNKMRTTHTPSIVAGGANLAVGITNMGGIAVPEALRAETMLTTGSLSSALGLTSLTKHNKQIQQTETRREAKDREKHEQQERWGGKRREWTARPNCFVCRESNSTHSGNTTTRNEKLKGRIYHSFVSCFWVFFFILTVLQSALTLCCISWSHPISASLSFLSFFYFFPCIFHSVSPFVSFLFKLCVLDPWFSFFVLSSEP